MHLQCKLKLKSQCLNHSILTVIEINKTINEFLKGNLNMTRTGIFSQNIIVFCDIQMSHQQKIRTKA